MAKEFARNIVRPNALLIRSSMVAFAAMIVDGNKIKVKKNAEANCVDGKKD